MFWKRKKLLNSTNKNLGLHSHLYKQRRRCFKLSKNILFVVSAAFITKGLHCWQIYIFIIFNTNLIQFLDDTA